MHPITIGAAPGHIVVTLAGNIQELPAVISIAVAKSGNHLPKARTVGTQSRSKHQGHPGGRVTFINQHVQISEQKER